MRQPWFKFFPTDAALDLLGMSIEARGAHITWLCKAWSDPQCTVRGGPDARARLAGFRGSAEAWESVEDELSSLWEFSPDGATSRALPGVRREAEQRAAASAAAAGMRWKARNDAAAMPPHCEGDAPALRSHCGPNAISEVRSQKSEARSQKSEKDIAPANAVAVVEASVAPRRVRETWLTPWLDAWREANGGDLPAGRAAKALSRLRDDPEGLAAWRNYLATTEARFASPEAFATRWRAFVPGTVDSRADDLATHNLRVRERVLAQIRGAS